MKILCWLFGHDWRRIPKVRGSKTKRKEKAYDKCFRCGKVQ